MMKKSALQQIAPSIWEIGAGYRKDMKVPCRVFASEGMLDAVLGDRSLEQLVNVATLEGIVRAAYVMPDVHEGYGFPIGGVAATRCPDGVVSPGGIGYDINCGVRLLRSSLVYDEIAKHRETLGLRLQQAVPSGVGKTGTVKLSGRQLDQVLAQGSVHAVRMGYGETEDLINTESKGCMSNADPNAVSTKAKNRGMDQLGTLGAGNHFIEVDVVKTIYDKEAARGFGLFEGQVVVMIHSGSRGLGHQVATDYIKTLMKAMGKYGIVVPDRELAGVPLNTPEGTSYFNAMAAAANYAWANRQCITHFVRQAWAEVFGEEGKSLSLLYDVAHNIAKKEEYGKEGELLVHRKGATRAFGPRHPELPQAYSKFGQPVIIPGSMGTQSYILRGTNASADLAFSSCCHGAGRQLSRSAAVKTIRGEDVIRELSAKGIIVKAGSLAGLSEEAPLAYKNAAEVVQVVHDVGLAAKVAKLVPIVVVKG